MSEEGQGQDGDRSSRFPTTQWTVVLQAAERGETAAAALESLCRAYWKPVYAYYRRSGHEPHDSEDLTQGFFADFLSRGSIDRAIPEKGRFRNYLLVAAKRFGANERRRAGARKRGGGHQLPSFDFAEAEGRLEDSMISPLTPDRAFDFQWVLSLIDRTFCRLRDDYEKRGEANLFAALQGFLEITGEPMGTYSEVARALGIQEGAVKTAVHRMRKRFRRHLREEVSATIGEGEDVDQELNALFGLLE